MDISAGPSNILLGPRAGAKMEKQFSRHWYGTSCCSTIWSSRLVALTHSGSRGSFCYSLAHDGRRLAGPPGGKRALVEDDEATTYILSRQLSRTGAIVTLVEDAEAALLGGGGARRRKGDKANRLMDLTGKYLIATIKDASARLLFDLPGAGPGRSEGQWTFVGRVEGETSGVGVWLAIEDIVNPEGLITPAPGPYTVLVRWEWIVTAVMTTEKLADLKSVRVVSSSQT
jgi:hypothetical protein